MNKTLCDADINRNKGNRTPFEFFRDAPDKWEQVQTRILRLVKEGRMLQNKADRFLSEEPPESFDELSERQLRETGYIATEAKKLLLRLGVPVQVSNGQATWQLRRLWGLNSILSPDAPHSKNRGDHRHHAVDALAVALTTPAFIKRLSDHYARQEKVEKHRFPEPWPGFWGEAKEKTDAIIVSHRTRRKISGALHEQTYYGDTGEETEDGKYRYYVTRKPLATITKSQIENIRDSEVRRIVTEHVEKHGGDIKKAMAAGLPGLVNKETGEIREIKKVRVLVKQQPNLMVELRPELKSHADPGSNHHMTIFDLGGGKADGKTVSRFKAIRRLKAGEPIIDRTSEKGEKFIMSLSIGDTVMFPPGKETPTPTIAVIQKLASNGQIYFRLHTYAGDARPKSLLPGPFLRTGVRKVKVDPIGRVRPAND